MQTPTFSSAARNLAKYSSIAGIVPPAELHFRGQSRDQARVAVIARCQKLLPFRVPCDRPVTAIRLRLRRPMRWLLTNRSPNGPGCGQRLLTPRIDRSELRLNHFVGKLAKSSRGAPAKYFANLIRATDQPGW